MRKMKLSHKSRYFRIKINPSDQIELKVSKYNDLFFNQSLPIDGNTQPHAESLPEIQDISLTGIGYITKSKSIFFKKGDQLKINMSFNEFQVSVLGEIRRYEKRKEGHSYGVEFLFNDSQEFNLFFEKFMKAFDCKRVLSELLNLLEGQSLFDYQNISVLEKVLFLNKNLLNKVNKSLDQEELISSLLKQWKLILKVDDILYLKINNENGIDFNFNGEQYSITYEKELIFKMVAGEKKTKGSLINEGLLSKIKKVIPIEFQNTLYTPSFYHCSPHHVKGLLLLNRKSEKLLFNHLDLKIIQFLSNQLSEIKTERKGSIKNHHFFLNKRDIRRYILIGSDDKISNLRRLVGEMKNNSEPILLSGNNGTGRSLLAHILHVEGRSSHKSFLCLNSEREGHLKIIRKLISTNKIPLEFNSFGTIYLENIILLKKYELDQLLKNVLNSISDVRIILNSGARSDDLKLPEKILKRVGNNKLLLPDLSERKEDIPSIIKHLLQAECQRRGLLKKMIDFKFMDKLSEHNWTGNIQEMKTAIRRLVEYYLNHDCIKDFPPDHYPLFLLGPNSESKREERENRLKLLLRRSEYTKKELALLFQRELILSELENHNGDIKKASLSIGRPLAFVEDIMARTSDIMDKYKMTG